jgi:hypothetical protein
MAENDLFTQADDAERFAQSLQIVILSVTLREHPPQKVLITAIEEP